MTVTALRGRLLDIRDNPFEAGGAVFYRPRGRAAYQEGGTITAAGPYAALRPSMPDGVTPLECRDAVITAGFIDTHVHYPQVEMIGAYGAQLLEWLDRYTFPTELKFADRDYAAAAAQLFMRELLRAGTTTAAVYCTVHPQSVDAFFTASERYNTCMVAGKMLMDRNAPGSLLEPPQTAYDESAKLIGRWHKKGRQLYRVTPRFAPSSTEGLLDAAGSLLRAHDSLYMQTHLSENLAEIDWVRSLFPARAGYLDVYAHAGLAAARSVFGHGIHLSEQEICTCHATGAALSHCPTSNLFLGSGLLRLFDLMDPRRPVRVGSGTDRCMTAPAGFSYPAPPSASSNQGL